MSIFEENGTIKSRPLGKNNIYLTLLLLNTTCIVLANSVDLDQLASEEANLSASSLCH